MKKNSKGIFLSTLCAMTLFMGGIGCAQTPPPGPIPSACNDANSFRNCQNNKAFYKFCCQYQNPSCITQAQCDLCGGACLGCAYSNYCESYRTEKGMKNNTQERVERHQEAANETSDAKGNVSE